MCVNAKVSIKSAMVGQVKTLLEKKNVKQCFLIDVGTLFKLERIDLRLISSEKGVNNDIIYKSFPFGTLRL